MRKLFIAMGAIALTLSAVACNGKHSADSENIKTIKADIAKVEKTIAKATPEEIAEQINKRSYALGANMGMAVNFQFGAMDLDVAALKDAIINFYLDGNVESEEFQQNNMKFQTFVYTRFLPFMQAKQTYDAMVEGGMTEELPEVPELYNEEFTKQFISETLGSQMGASLIDVDGLSMGWLFKGFNDSMAIEEQDMEAIEAGLLISTNDIQTELMNLQREMMEKQRAEQQKKAEEAKLASAEWLAEVEKQEGVQKTESGLLYRIDREGNDVFATEDSDVVEVNYEGKTRNGNIFDSSYERGESISFALNRVSRGWTEGMKLVGEGGQITLWIPSELAYGERGAGQDIGANEALEFKVELIKVNPEN